MPKKIKLTDQRLVDYVCRKLKAQGSGAWEDSGCVNKTEDGRRCALGICFKNADHWTNSTLSLRLQAMGASRLTVNALLASHDHAARAEAMENASFYPTFRAELASRIRFLAKGAAEIKVPE